MTGLGVVDIVFRPLGAVEAAERAAELGFTHIDTTEDPGGAELALPVVDRYSPVPRPGWSTGAPPDEPGRWDWAVAKWRSAPGSRIEPWPGSIINTVEKVRAFLAAVPDTTLLLDTGHVATWGEDPADLVEHAGHVQLRQARPGVPQAVDGDIDFAAFFARARAVGYQGAFSIEYFDLPGLGWPLDDPVAHAVALAERVRPLLDR